MTKTVVESKTKTATIGFDQPFTVIGERINPTGRKILNAQLEAGDFSTVASDAIAQVEAGATILDVNSGAVFQNKMAEDVRYADNNFVEPPLMKQLIELVQTTVDVPICIDSSVPGALQAGLEACEGRPLVNSVTGESERMEEIFPLIKKYNVPVVAISNDETGISQDPDVRFAVAKRIVERAADYGIPAHDIVVDPLVMPIGAMGSAGLQVFTINNAFLAMAMTAGMTSAIMNPIQIPVSEKKLQAKRDELAAAGIIVPDDIDPEILATLTGMGSTKSKAGKEMESIRAANYLMDKDSDGSAWIEFNKLPASAGGGGRREGRRRRRG